MKKKLTKPQRENLLALVALGGVVPASEWVNGNGRYTKMKAIPPGCAVYNVEQAGSRLRGETLAALQRLVLARPRVRRVVAVVDMATTRLDLLGSK
jgi:hypothetical protein